ncbi:MAG: tripartite tricarboxylate transporter substrate binding protein [Betaproteobacteria bacterium]|nr:tripartite tricarboxylate transporter substrate binding protein [Betaproteobacteria bacterium]
MRGRMLFYFSLLLMGIAGGQAWSQTYPVKPVRVFVGYSPGGSVDTVGRIFAQKLTGELGQQFVVENRPGAASNIAGDLVAKSPPDGYTLLMSSGTALGTNMAIYTKMPYNPLKDFAPIAMLVYQGNALVVNPTVPAKTVKELIALAKARPAQLNFGSGGNGSSQHMTAELFSKMTGVKMVHVPYKGGAPALVDLIAGQIDLVFSPLPEAIPYIQSGRVRALGVTGGKRSANLPDLPTIAEGGVPSFEFEGFLGIAGPAGMPKNVVARLNAALNKALTADDVKKRMYDLGLRLAGGTPEQLATHMREQAALMIQIAKDAGVKPVD